MVDMVMTVAVLAVVGTLAVPGFKSVMRDSARAAAVNAYMHAIFLARSEAIKRNQVVSICRSRDAQTCLYGSTPWAEGWMVFVNQDRDEPPARDSGEPLIEKYEGWPAGSMSSNRAAYSFRPMAQGTVNGTILFCDPRGSRYSRAIIISHTGRPRISARNAEGKPLACPG